MKYEKIPYNPEEFNTGKTFQPVLPVFDRLKAPDFPISPLENFKRTMEGEPLWLSSDSDFLMFAPSIIPENVARGMVVEAEPFPESEYGGKDYFGIDWEYVPTAGGSMVCHGDPFLDDISEWEEKIVFPDLSAWDWEGSVQKNKELLSEGRPVKMVIYTGFFERLISFTDMQEALIAMIDEDQQEDVIKLFDRLADFYIELLSYMKKYFNIKMVWFHDDWGSQKAPFFSYNTINEVLAPALKKVIDACHEMDIIFEMHSCGKMGDLVDLMADLNVDIWDGQELDDKPALFKKYKGKMGIEVEVNLEPGLSEDQLRAYVNEILDTYGKGIFLGKTFKNDSALYAIAYEESRKRYSQQ